VANLRGSGTEPKLKYYVELSGSDRAAVTAELIEMVRPCPAPSPVRTACTQTPGWGFSLLWARTPPPSPSFVLIGHAEPLTPY